jgi:hypothetical protein
MNPEVPSMIPKQKDKAWNGALQDTKNFDFKSKRKRMMLVTFFESQGIIHKEFVALGHTENKE